MSILGQSYVYVGTTLKKYYTYMCSWYTNYLPTTHKLNMFHWDKMFLMMINKRVDRKHVCRLGGWNLLKSTFPPKLFPYCYVTYLLSRGLVKISSRKLI